MAEIDVVAGVASKTTTDVERGIDVDFSLTLDGEEMDGEVTLLPHEDGRRGFGRWGSVDNWLDGATVRRIRDLDRDTWSDVLSAIETACAEAADAADID